MWFASGYKAETVMINAWNIEHEHRIHVVHAHRFQIAAFRLAVSLRSAFARVRHQALAAMPITHEQAKAGAGKVVVGRRHENETFKIMMRQHTMSFMEADLNGDGCIDEAEFMLALPDHVKQKHTEAEMKG